MGVFIMYTFIDLIMYTKKRTLKTLRNWRVTLRVLVLGVLGVMFFLLRPTYAEPVNFSVCSDSSGLDVLLNLPWGSLGVGESKTKSVYIVNNFDQPLTALSYCMLNVEPQQAEQYLSLSGTYAVNIAPDQVGELPLTLNVSPDVIGFSDFTFDVEITAGFSESIEPDAVQSTPDQSVTGDTDASDLSSVETSTGGGGGGGGYRVIDFEESTTIPTERPKLTLVQGLVLLGALYVVLSLFGGKRR